MVTANDGPLSDIKRLHPRTVWGKQILILARRHQEHAWQSAPAGMRMPTVAHTFRKDFHPHLGFRNWAFEGEGQYSSLISY